MTPYSLPPRSASHAPATLWDSVGRAASLAAPLPPPKRMVATTPGSARAELIVLASSSSGNASALIVGTGKMRRVTLIDGGLSPRRTYRCLGALGLGPEHLDRIIFTHLDRDHAHAGWVRGLPRHAEFVIHRRHRARGERMGMLVRRTRIFNEPFELPAGIIVQPTLAAHDDLGVVAFRFQFPSDGTDQRRSLGYATDLGRVPDALLDAFQGVQHLAIESNYCPEMQHASDRPDFLKHRIMNGSGHLSNEECVQAVRQINPTQSVVLLHLSRECNTPERAAAGHAGAPYELAISDWSEPIPGIRV